MTLARRDRDDIRLGPAPWHRHRGVWAGFWRDGVWVDGKTGELTHGRITVRIRRCAICPRVDIRETWPGGKRKTVR